MPATVTRPDRSTESERQRPDQAHAGDVHNHPRKANDWEGVASGEQSHRRNQPAGDRRPKEVMLSAQQRGRYLVVAVFIRCEARGRNDQPDGEPNDDGERDGPDGYGAIVYLSVPMPSNSLTMRSPGLVVALAILLAMALVASPLLVVIGLATPFLIARLTRGLPPAERSFLIGLLTAAVALRAVLVAVQMIRGIPLLNDMSIGALAGDESYYLSRAIRVRDLLFGYGTTTYDFFVATDEYGKTSYLSLLTWLQIFFGPTPYSMKIVNGVLQVGGAALLFRMARASFGVLPAFLGLAITLFLPSLVFMSVSLLKESAYFALSSVFVVCGWNLVTAVRERRWGVTVTLAVTACVSLWLLDSVRRGALGLLGGGLVLGLVLWYVGQSRRLAAGAIAVAAIGLIAVGTVPAVHERFVTAVEQTAKIQAGHVFTVGHAYKLMDEGFYRNPQTGSAWDLRLSDSEAARFLARAAISFFVTPWPWQMRSRSELAFMPEHMVWYLLIAALPFGIVAGWRVNPLATALFCGFAIPTAAVIAVTNGNVGTLLRLRGLVTPYLAWMSALGLCVIGEWLSSLQQTRTMMKERPAL